MAETGSDYFLNSITAVQAQHQYAVANPLDWSAYSQNIWGISGSFV